MTRFTTNRLNTSAAKPASATYAGLRQSQPGGRQGRQQLSRVEEEHGHSEPEGQQDERDDPDAEQLTTPVGEGEGEEGDADDEGADDRELVHVAPRRPAGRQPAGEDP